MIALLIDPVGLALLVLNEFLRFEPQCDFLLCVLDTVRAVADVATDVLCKLVRAVINAQDGKGSWLLTMAKSPRMVPGADARGLVAPRMAVI